MDVSIKDLHRFPIKRLKAILKKLMKEPKSVEILTTINLIKNIIASKKKEGLILHPGYMKTPKGTVRQIKCKPIHLN